MTKNVDDKKPDASSFQKSSGGELTTKNQKDTKIIHSIDNKNSISTLRVQIMKTGDTGIPRSAKHEWCQKIVDFMCMFKSLFSECKLGTQGFEP